MFIKTGGLDDDILIDLPQPGGNNIGRGRPTLGVFLQKLGDERFDIGTLHWSPSGRRLLLTLSDRMVVMDLDGANDAAAWGGLASRIAQRRGVRGTVMWGACRDVEEIREVGYPVWAVATCPRRSRNAFTFGSINQPITIGGVTIGARDFVLADESGVVMVPAAVAVAWMRAVYAAT